MHALSLLVVLAAGLGSSSIGSGGGGLSEEDADARYCQLSGGAGCSLTGTFTASDSITITDAAADGVSVITTSTNDDLSLAPNGSGQVVIGTGHMIEFEEGGFIDQVSGHLQIAPLAGTRYVEVKNPTDFHVADSSTGVVFRVNNVASTGGPKGSVVWPWPATYAATDCDNVAEIGRVVLHDDGTDTTFCFCEDQAGTAGWRCPAGVSPAGAPPSMHEADWRAIEAAEQKTLGAYGVSTLALLLSLRRRRGDA